MSEGTKFDQGKARFDLIPPEMLWGLAKLYGMGAAKYGDRNWEQGFDFSRPYAALQRHANAWYMGEDYCLEDGQHHLLSVIWNATALYFFQQYSKGQDDRPVQREDVEDYPLSLPSRPTRVYIAGPYTPNDNEYATKKKNVKAAEEAAIAYLEHGYVPFCPHSMTFGWERSKYCGYEDFMLMDLQWLSTCDAIHLLPNWADSKGARREKEFAESHNIEIFYEFPWEPEG